MHWIYLALESESYCYQGNKTLDYKEHIFLEQLDGCHLNKFSTT